jgi:tetratricopeptide (TPR) repeat protein
MKLEEFSDAIPFLEEAAAEYEQLPTGQSGMVFSIAQHMQGLCAIRLGKYPEAVQLLEGVVTAREKQFGINHPMTQMVKIFLLMAQFELTRDNNCIEELKQIYQSCKTLDQSISAAYALAGCYQTGELYQESTELLQKVLKDQIEKFGEKHLEVLITRRKLARIIYLKGEKEEAIQEFRNIIKMEVDLVGERHPQSIVTKKIVRELPDISEEMVERILM